MVLGLVSLPPSVRAITTAGSKKKGFRPYQEERRERRGRREGGMKREERRERERRKERGEEGGRE